MLCTYKVTYEMGLPFLPEKCRTPFTVSQHQRARIPYTVSDLLNQDLTHTLNFQDFILSNYRH